LVEGGEEGVEGEIVALWSERWMRQEEERENGKDRKAMRR
jgi:hypothetical protein